MQTQFVSGYLVLAAFTALACEDDATPSTVTTPLTPTADAGGADAAPAVPAELSCGGLVGGSTCDPVTAWPCDTSRETCDYSVSAGAYRCIAIPNQQPLCAPCDVVDTYCGPGLLCSREFGCQRFCCVDADCPIGRCLPNPYGDDDVASVGYCEDETRVVCSSDAGAGELPTP